MWIEHNGTDKEIQDKDKITTYPYGSCIKFIKRFKNLKNNKHLKKKKKKIYIKHQSNNYNF